MCREVVALHSRWVGSGYNYLPRKANSVLLGSYKTRGTNSHLRFSQHVSRCCLPNGCVWKTELNFVKVLKFGVSFLLAFFRSTRNIPCLSTCRYINERFIPVGLLDFLLLSQPNALVMNAHGEWDHSGAWEPNPRVKSPLWLPLLLLQGLIGLLILGIYGDIQSWVLDSINIWDRRLGLGPRL